MVATLQESRLHHQHNELAYTARNVQRNKDATQSVDKHEIKVIYFITFNTRMETNDVVAKNPGRQKNGRTPNHLYMLRKPPRSIFTFS